MLTKRKMVQEKTSYTIFLFRIAKIRRKCMRVKLIISIFA